MKKIVLLLAVLSLLTISQKAQATVIWSENFDRFTSDFVLDTGFHACPVGNYLSNSKGCYGNAVKPAVIGTAHARIKGTNKRGFFQPIFDSWAAAGSNPNDPIGNEIGLGVIFPKTIDVMYIRWYQKDTYVQYVNFQKLFRISNGTLGSVGNQRFIPGWNVNGSHVQMSLGVGTGTGAAGSWIGHFFTGYNLDTNYTPGTWKCYEIKIDTVNKVGELWVDGSSKGKVSLSDALASGVRISAMQVGGNHSYKVGQSGHSITYDDVVVADSYIGCAEPSLAEIPAPTNLRIQ